MYSGGHDGSPSFGTGSTSSDSFSSDFESGDNLRLTLTNKTKLSYLFALWCSLAGSRSGAVGSFEGFVRR